MPGARGAVENPRESKDRRGDAADDPCARDRLLFLGLKFSRRRRFSRLRQRTEGPLLEEWFGWLRRRQRRWRSREQTRAQEHEEQGWKQRSARSLTSES